ncbi:hypothetical protein H1R20_g10151, partial [Candolleomyces eurysporus]
MNDKVNSTVPDTPTDVNSLPQIKLLHTAISLLKVHAEDAGSNIEKLRVLLANRDTEPATYRSLQRQRFFEERRELDAHRALWSTTQKVSAIIHNDALTFEHQQLSDHSLGLFHYHAGEGPNPERSSRIREHSRLIPLTLAPKADYRPPKRASKPPPLDNASFDHEKPSSSSTSSYTPPLHRMPSGKSGTAAIFHHTAKPDRQRLAQQIRDVEVTMPDYVGNLLSEFDSASNPPLLPLTSPQTSPHKRIIDLPPSLSPTKAKPLQLLGDIAEETNSGGAKPRTSEHQPRVLKRKGSQKRFSNLFSSKKSHGSAPPSSFPGDFVPPLQSAGSSALTSPPLSSAATSYSSPSSPLRSSFSMSALQAEDAPPVSPSAKRFSANSVISLVSSSAHDHHHQQAPPEEKKDGVTSRIKKRISKLRG